MKLLLRATNWVGDVVMSLPSLRALRTSFPSAHLSVLARPWVAALYRSLAEVDEVVEDDSSGVHRGAAGRERLARELAGKGFDVAVVLPRSFATALTVFRARIPVRVGYRGELRSPLLTRAVPFRHRAGEHQVFQHLALARAAGAAVPAAPDVSWPVPAPLVAAARERLLSAGWRGEPFAAAHVASFAHTAKRWDLARYAELFARLASRHSLVTVLLGAASERAMNREVVVRGDGARVLDLAGESSLPEVLGLLALATLFVGNDSGIAHLAGAVGTRTTVVFGSTDPDATRPWDGPRGDGRPVRVRVARERALCAPCRSFVCPLDHRCMDGLPVARVLSEVEASLLS